MRHFGTAFLVLAFGALPLARAQQVTIDFDSLPVATTVTNQFPEAVFSSSPGNQNTTRADFELGTSLPYICTETTTGVLNCTADTYVDFTTPVSNLTFMQGGDNATGVIAQVRVFAGGVLAGTVPIMGDGIFASPCLVDLTAFDNVTRIEIFNITDPGGLAWDDFSFDVSCASLAVSGGEPGTTLSLALSGAPAGAPAFVFLGAQLGSASLPFGPLGTLELGVVPPWLIRPMGLTDATGSAQVGIRIPPIALPCHTGFAQATTFELAFNPRPSLVFCTSNTAQYQVGSCSGN